MTAHAGAAPGVRGPGLMTLLMLAFTLNDTFMKAASAHLPLFQALFLRGLVTVAVLGALAWHAGAIRLPAARADRIWLGLRTLGEIGAACFFVAALFRMPLANVTAILQALPLCVTAAAALFLGERVGPRRWAAVAVGLCGMALIVRPGAAGWGWPVVLALLAVASVTLRDIATRKMGAQVPAPTLALAAALGVTAVAALALPFAERAPLSAPAAAAITGSALCIVGGYLLSVVVMRAGELSLTAPFRYTGLVWALLAGWLVFGDWPDTLTLLGAAIVVGAGLFTLWRERQVAAPESREGRAGWVRRIRR